MATRTNVSHRVHGCETELNSLINILKKKRRKWVLRLKRNQFISVHRIKMMIFKISLHNDSEMQWRKLHAADLIIINKTQKMLLPSVKKTPVLGVSECIYEFTYIWGSKYIGRTERCLSTGIKEHLPTWLFKSMEKIPKSSITKPLLDSDLSVDVNSSLEVVNKQSNFQLLKFAEACTIRICRPNLCIQKDMVVNLRLPC